MNKTFILWWYDLPWVSLSVPPEPVSVQMLSANQDLPYSYLQNNNTLSTVNKLCLMIWRMLGIGRKFETDFIFAFVLDSIPEQRSPMAQWLRQQCLRNMKCTVHDLVVMGSNPSQVELGMCSTSVKDVVQPKYLLGGAEFLILQSVRNVLLERFWYLGLKCLLNHRTK